MNKLKYDSKGSTLIVLLLIISVIVLIGTMVMSLAVFNFKMKKTNSLVKQNFYLAEAGIEESLVIAKEFVAKAFDYAVSKAEEFNEIDNQINNKINNRLFAIADEITEDRRNIVFSKAFKNFIKGNCTDIYPNHSLISVLKNSESYVVYNNGYPKISPKIIEGTNFFQIEVKSTYMNGYIRSDITLKYEINIPNYSDIILNNELKSEDIIRIIEWKKER
ncbi:hypothetical protein DW1_1727 [Proteiniborus sp. DW1]|uniref:pilus assembly PilX N-terminal domain-containing protein n=1 Tax=Proteiniborus sp. DW1 TaxID=1889883 RepID=UPI00092E157C|nr:pilus assembly PilX N-terminal domain-containing protein [Proteiniborus sp. DW1]SCG83297.1 hypothetical protein DW1_1727 [Proteiniborus sp. DW1]